MVIRNFGTNLNLKPVEEFKILFCRMYIIGKLVLKMFEKFTLK